MREPTAPVPGGVVAEAVQLQMGKSRDRDLGRLNCWGPNVVGSSQVDCVLERVNVESCRVIEYDCADVLHAEKGCCARTTHSIFSRQLFKFFFRSD